MSKYRVKFDKGWTEVARDEVETKTKSWNKRGAAGQVRSDITTCMRQAYYGAHYRHLLPASGKTLPDDLVKIFYAGHVIDELVGPTFDKLGEDYKAKVHRQQNRPPVQMKHPESSPDGLSFAVTTDYVLEYDDGSLVPFEIKSTAKETKGWATMAYLPQNLKQLMYWVFYAKAHGLKVPCANLVYVKRSDFKAKQVIVSVDKNVSEGFSGEITYVDGHKWLDYIEDEFEMFKTHWNENSLPDKPRIVSSSTSNAVSPKDIYLPPSAQFSIPNYMCKNCSYKQECDGDLNTDVIAQYNAEIDNALAKTLKIPKKEDKK